MDINRLKNATKKLIEATSELSLNSEHPFEVQVKAGVDASKTKPYYVETNIRYGDRIFKKRMSTIFNEENLLLEYEFNKENHGTIFKPNYKTNIEIKITQQILSVSTAAALEILSLGLAETHLTKERVIRLDSIKKHKEYFYTELEKNLFAEKVKAVLNGLLNNYYNDYKRIV